MHSHIQTDASTFDEHAILHELKHFLPAQSPLKDFVHHNTLHAFQDQPFFVGLQKAHDIFGYKSSLTIDEYRTLYKEERISEEVLDNLLAKKKAGKESEWKHKLLSQTFNPSPSPRVGQLRSHWKKQYHVDLDSMVHPILFRILGSYLDQGITMWNFPVNDIGLISSVRELERNSFISFFKTKRAKNLLIKSQCEIEDLLTFVIGDETLFKQYLFDQQFSHQGWSGMVSAVEDFPETLLDQKKISLKELIILELLLEIDALDYVLGENWTPLVSKIDRRPTALFAPLHYTYEQEALELWQEAFEWTYYDQVLSGIKEKTIVAEDTGEKSFQAMFCIDDRECSLRRYIEKFDHHCETFGTPGFFNVEFYFQPEHGKFYTKLCPAPMTPKYLIKEVGVRVKRKQDFLFRKNTHTLVTGWLISQTLGFWSAFQLFINIFKPSMSPATSSSFNHMVNVSKLTIDNRSLSSQENGLQIGFTIEEMATRVEGLLRSIGLIKNFAPIVYTIGHGSSTINNPHYAAYDCGACCGRPGSVNARVISHMANHPQVREILATKGIEIPKETQFVGGLHDTTRDDIQFFDENRLLPSNKKLHKKNEAVFAKGLNFNAKERSRRFESIDTHLTPEEIHEEVRKRSVSLFEPRPELNHATNALCVIGRRELTKGLFLDRRSFMNSYNYTIDPDGTYLLNIVKAAAPVCGGINLEYFFSRVDNQKLGAGTKLPHNVVGLIAVANGIDGDLRPGLPSQMIEVHDPIRLLMIIEHYPEVVLATFQKSAVTFEWFINGWINLVVVHPETKQLLVFKDGGFTEYLPLGHLNNTITNLTNVIESNRENLPVYPFEIN